MQLFSEETFSGKKEGVKYLFIAFIYVVFGVQVQIMLIWDSCRDSICLELCFFRFYVQLKVLDLNQQYQSQEEKSNQTLL